MAPRQHPITQAWLESLTSGVIELRHDWRARHPPPLNDLSRLDAKRYGLEPFDPPQALQEALGRGHHAPFAEDRLHEDAAGLGEPLEHERGGHDRPARQMIAEENPIIPAIDQDLWAQRLDYNKRKLSQALETFRRTRAENYELLKDLPEEAFGRTAQHTKRGVVTLMQMLEIFARHPEKHVGQIQAVRAAYKEFKASQAQQAAQ